jgi:hypothetical protein
MRTGAVIVHNTVDARMKKAAKSIRKHVVGNERANGHDIDLTDIPEVKDWSKAVVGKFRRPAKRSLPTRPSKSRK